MAKWTTRDMPPQAGRRVVVTGANSGLGKAAAAELAAAGADVVLACRDVRKGKAAAATMTGRVEVRRLDLADLASVHAFADDIDALDVLVNNAGVMAVPRGTTADGFELQFGTNHLGHFALTGLLLGRIRERVVTVSSPAHRFGRIDLGDPNWTQREYRRWPAYAQSKLANLLFAYELQRRLAASGSAVRSVAAHPGYSRTEINSNYTRPPLSWLMALGDRIGAAQPARVGALTTLYAATVDIPGGTYIGPSWPGEMRGYPRRVGSSRRARDADVARGLWDLSERLTGVSYLDGR
ncbi:MAG TPA: oxidoreductase [Jatrophihabitantaceae bacterium]|nr:oxidoreductase [Jatrophihabitantaceae bacterium]